MGKSVYITDPVVAAAYGVHPGEWAFVADDAEAAWIVLNRHAFTLHHQDALPSAYYVDPSAPNPFVPFDPSPAPAPSPSPAPRPRAAFRTPPLAPAQTPAQTPDAADPAP
jgi:hypothetical protein